MQMKQQRAVWDVTLCVALTVLSVLCRGLWDHDRLLCDPFIISHLTARQNGTAAVKHLQGYSIGCANTFCLAISLSVEGTRQIGCGSIC